MDVVVAFDVGSSSVRCSAYSLKNSKETRGDALRLSSALCSASRDTRNVDPSTGRVIIRQSDSPDSQHHQHQHQQDQEQPAHATTLMDEIDSCLDQVLDDLRSNEGEFSILAVGFTSFVMNLIAVDVEGNPVRISDKDEDGFVSATYACNTPRVTKECHILREELGSDRLDALYRRTGAPIHNSYALPQLRAISDASHDKVDMWQTISSLCLSRWMGRPHMPISYSEASWTGLLAFATCHYDDEALSLLPERSRDALPELEDFDDSEYTMPEKVTRRDASVKNPYLQRWPELGGVRLFLGFGDGACANIGSKCSTSARIAVTVGTSAAARICLPQGIVPHIQKGDACATEQVICIPNGLFCYRVDKSQILVGGALTDGGSAIEWASQLLNLDKIEHGFSNCMKDARQLYEQDCAIASNEDGGRCDEHYLNLSVLPFLSGERSTGYRDSAKGAIIGLTRDTTSNIFMKSCLEGVALRLRAVLHLVLDAREEDPDIKGPDSDAPTIIVSGKALEKNGLWRQMLADASGLQVIADEETSEGTSRGVARMIAVAVSKSDSEKGRTMSQLLLDEPLCPAETIRPTSGGQIYFDKAARAHDKFLDAVSPLFVS